MESKYLVQKLADHYSELELTLIPHEVVKKSRISLVDFIAATVVGYREGVLPPVINKYLIEKHSKKESTWLSLNEKTSSVDAAMSMGVAAHSVELDDGHRFGTSHPAAAIIPAVLAISEREEKTFIDIIKAIIIGYDAMLRIAKAINPSHLCRGFHTTGTCGVIGSAFACASLLNLNSEKTAYAVSIAMLQSSGLQEMLHDNPSIKALQAGRAASNGLLSADLSNAGAQGPRSIFEGEHGWLKAFTDEHKVEEIVENLGESYEIMNTYTKLYPTCRHCHPGIDLAVQARNEFELIISSINRIIIKTYKVAIDEVGKHYYPKNFDQAMFSLPYSIALALKNGKVTLQDYNDINYQDEVLRKIQEKTVVIEDDLMNKQYPISRGAHLRIEFTGGNVWEKRVALPMGEPETPLTKEMLLKKLEYCMEPYYTDNVKRALWKICVDDDYDHISYKQILSILSQPEN